MLSLIVATDENNLTEGDQKDGGKRKFN